METVANLSEGLAGLVEGILNFLFSGEGDGKVGEKETADRPSMSNLENWKTRVGPARKEEIQLLQLTVQS